MANRFDVKGSMVALITPFHEDGSINFDKLEELLEFHIANKTDAILVLGTTSESPTFSAEEDFEIVKRSVEVCKGRVPLMANGGSNCTQTSFEKAKRFADAGVDALLCISPYYNKANKAGLYHHIADVADSVDVPVVVYNIPGRTGINIPLDVMTELAKKDNIAGVKEATGDMSYVAKLAKATKDMDFNIWSGNDDITVPMMALGGAGCISVWANLQPEKTVEMTHSFLEGNVQHAIDMQLEYMDLINDFFIEVVQHAIDMQLEYMDLINDFFIEVNPIPIKEAMNMAGMGVGGFRMPLCEMTDANREILRAEMKKLGII
ncbi:MAG: 4-hydroxy-tetrahydrodipicolinate synthase [Firmicutes bacterium]|nr:4-hydroxy-tetrahydrodipicolinate synthase [Bacillota bacterium]